MSGGWTWGAARAETTKKHQGGPDLRDALHTVDCLLRPEADRHVGHGRFCCSRSLALFAALVCHVAGLRRRSWVCQPALPTASAMTSTISQSAPSTSRPVRWWSGAPLLSRAPRATRCRPCAAPPRRCSRAGDREMFVSQQHKHRPASAPARLPAATAYRAWKYASCIRWALRDMVCCAAEIPCRKPWRKQAGDE